MNIFALNGSPRKQGNTYHMLKTITDICGAAGFKTEIYQAGGQPVMGCLACNACAAHKGKCATDDWINDV